MARRIEKTSCTVPDFNGRDCAFDRFVWLDTQTGEFSISIPTHIALLFQEETIIEDPDHSERIEAGKPFELKPVTYRVKAWTFRTRNRDEYMVLLGKDLKALKRIWTCAITHFRTVKTSSCFVIKITCKGHITGFDDVPGEDKDETRRRYIDWGLMEYYGQAVDRAELHFSLLIKKAVGESDPQYFRARLNENGEPEEGRHNIETVYSDAHLIDYTPERWEMLVGLRRALRGIAIVLGEHFGKTSKPEAIAALLDSGRLQLTNSE